MPAAAALLFCALVLRADWPALRYALAGPGGWSAGLFLANSLLPLVEAALLSAAAWGLGAAVFFRRAEAPSGPEAPAAAFALGAGLLGTGILALGVAGLLRKPFVLGELAAAAVATAVLAAGPAWRGWKAYFKSGRSSRPKLPGLWILQAALAFGLWHGLVVALAPPVDLDVLAYHLAIPKLYWSAGRIAEIPWLIYAHWPHLTGLLYIPALALGRDAVAALLNWTAGAALILALFLAARRWLDEPTAWLCAALWAVQPVVARFSGTARSDVWVALFHFSACACAWRWREGGGRGDLVRAGLLAGLAAASKLTGAFSVAGLAVLVAAGRRGSFKSAATLAACGLAAPLPWYWKAWRETGNPVWPFLSRLFGGRPAGFLPGYLASARWAPGDVVRYHPEFLLVPLVGLGALFLRMPRREKIPPFLAFLLLAGLPYAASLPFDFDGWRLALPLLAAVALTAAWLGARLLREGGAAAWLSGALLAFGLSPVLMLSQNNELFAALQLPSSAFPGLTPRSAYLRHVLPGYALFEQANRTLNPRADRVLLCGLTRGYYLDAPYQWAAEDHQDALVYDDLDGPAALAARLKGLGITHVIVDDGYVGLGARARALTAAMVNEDARLVLRDGPLALYQLK